MQTLYEKNHIEMKEKAKQKKKKVFVMTRIENIQKISQSLLNFRLKKSNFVEFSFQIPIEL